MDCSPPGSSVHGVLQARLLEWVAMPSSRGSSWPRDQICASCITGRLFPTSATRGLILHDWLFSDFPRDIRVAVLNLSCTLETAGEIWKDRHWDSPPTPWPGWSRARLVSALPLNVQPRSPAPAKGRSLEIKDEGGRLGERPGESGERAREQGTQLVKDRSTACMGAHVSHETEQSRCALLAKGITRTLIQWKQWLKGKIPTQEEKMRMEIAGSRKQIGQKHHHYRIPYKVGTSRRR